MSSSFNRLGNFTLIFQAISSNSTRKEFSLFINEAHKKIRILVVNKLDVILLETTKFLFSFTDVYGTKETYILTSCHNSNSLILQ